MSHPPRPPLTATAPRTVSAVPHPPARPWRPRRLAWSLAVAFACQVLPTQAQVTGAQAVHGTVQLSTQGNRTLITTTNGAGTQHSVVNWQSFSIPTGSSTYIAQPSSDSTSVNRVVTANPTSIYGTLGSNGQVILINPAGITVGAGAVVDTVGFTASTLALSEAQAKSGQWQLGDGRTSSGQIQIDGQVIARGGSVVLVAPRIATGQDALIQAADGSVILAAGQQAEIVSRDLAGVRLLVQAPTDQAVNLGKLSGNAVGLFASQLRHSGQIDVQAVNAGGGQVELRAKDSLTLDGRVRAQGLNQSSTASVLPTAGGDISLQAGGLLSISNASITSEGGNISLTGGNTSSMQGGTGVRIANGALVDSGGGSISIVGNSDSGTGVDISGGERGSATPSRLQGAHVKILAATLTGAQALRIKDSSIQTSAGASLNAVGNLTLQNAQVTNQGSDSLRLAAFNPSSTAGAATTSAITLDTTSQLSSTGTGEIELNANRMHLAGTISTGSNARVVLTPNHSNRAIVLGGVDNTQALYLSNAALQRIQAGTLVVGGRDYTGGLTVAGAITPSGVHALSLIQSPSSTINQASDSPITVNSLNADAGTVNLGADNGIQIISGRAYGDTGFNFKSAAQTLKVGKVDGIEGIVSGTAAAPAPITLEMTAPGSQLTQAAEVPLRGSEITLTGPDSGSSSINLAGVSASSQLSFWDWGSVYLNGLTEFNSISFRTGSQLIQVSSTGGLAPGGLYATNPNATIEGNLLMAEGSRLHVDVTDASTYDKVTVYGTLKLDKTFKLVMYPLIHGQYEVFTSIVPVEPPPVIPPEVTTDVQVLINNGASGVSLTSDSTTSSDSSDSSEDDSTTPSSEGGTTDSSDGSPAPQTKARKNKPAIYTDEQGCRR